MPHHWSSRGSVDPEIAVVKPTEYSRLMGALVHTRCLQHGVLPVGKYGLVNSVALPAAQLHPVTVKGNTDS